MKKLILIVDDTPHNIQMLATILSDHNYDIAVAMNGSEALNFVEHTQPELVLLDIMMPNMDGYETCKLMKQIPQMSTVPVIFLTAKSETEDLVKGFDAGGVDYVTKPFHVEELLARIKTHMELKQAREEIETLRGLITICSYCKKILNDEGTWDRLESYIQHHSKAVFTHSICPQCYDNQMKKIIETKHD